jgi:hypothetical protein
MITFAMTSSDTIASKTRPLITLPLELIITIIEELAADNDRDTLCALSLVCHSLAPICQKHIFHTFDLRIGSLYARASQIVDKFARFLFQHPHLISYVRAVHILELGCSWIHKTSGLAYIIRYLTSLHTFELIVTIRRGSWDFLPSYLKEAFFIMVCRSNFHTLLLTGMANIPLLLLTQASHLKSFHVHKVSFKTMELEFRQCHLPILEELSWGHSSRLLQIFMENAYFDLSRLRKITIDITSKSSDFKLSWSLIARAGNSLQHLKFCHSDMKHRLNFFCLRHGSEHEHDHSF